jgi:hypothetical protein
VQHGAALSHVSQPYVAGHLWTHAVITACCLAPNKRLALALLHSIVPVSLRLKCMECVSVCRACARYQLARRSLLPVLLAARIQPTPIQTWGLRSKPNFSPPVLAFTCGGRLFGLALFKVAGGLYTQM